MGGRVENKSNTGTHTYLSSVCFVHTNRLLLSTSCPKLYSKWSASSVTRVARASCCRVGACCGDKWSDRSVEKRPLEVIRERISRPPRDDTVSCETTTEERSRSWERSIAELRRRGESEGEEKSRKARETPTREETTETHPMTLRKQAPRENHATKRRSCSPQDDEIHENTVHELFFTNDIFNNFSFISIAHLSFSF